MGVDKPEIEDAIEFVTGMLRSIRSQPKHAQVLAFREQIEMYAVLPEMKDGEVHDTFETIDLTFNVDKLPELVQTYERTRNPYALEVLLAIANNALSFSRPIPGPMVDLVRQWILNDGVKRTRAADPQTLSRNSSLVSAIMVFRERAGIRPTRNAASDHNDSGCDFAVKVWNQIVEERKVLGEHWPHATYEAALSAWKDYEKSRRGNIDRE